MLQKVPTVLLVLLLAVDGVYAATQGEEERGYTIAQEADHRNMGWNDMSATLNMTLRNSYGEESHRSLRLRTLEVVGDGDKSLVVFEAPPDVKGAALLSHAHTRRSDDQWLYFPALKRVKRISSANKSGPFMGSEFAYEDMAPWELDKFKYRYIGDQAVNDEEVYVLELYPQYENSGYTRQVLKLDKQHYRPLVIEYFDRKGVILKTQVFSGYDLYLNKYWRAKEMKMMNHQTGKQTVLIWRDYIFHTGFNDRDFDKDSLDRLN